MNIVVLSVNTVIFLTTFVHCIDTAIERRISLTWGLSMNTKIAAVKTSSLTVVSAVYAAV